MQVQIKNITKAKILQYIINNQDTSKVELSKKLNLSMPTVLSNVNDLIERGSFLRPVSMLLRVEGKQRVLQSTPDIAMQSVW